MRRRAGAVLAAGLAVAAAIAATQLPAAPHSQPSAGTIRFKLLAAWAAAGNDILVTHSVSPGGGPTHAVESSEDWWVYPWAASPGQHVQVRSLISYRGQRNDGLTCEYQMGSTAAVPGIHVDYPDRIWSKVTVRGCQRQLSPADLRSQIASGMWRVSGPAEFRGHQAFKLTTQMTVPVRPGQIAQSTTQLWVDASTYLPLYEYTTTRGVDAGPPVTASFELLSPTPANLALLRPMIPPGFRQMP